MPPQALALAFAASIYPPAVAAVIALGRGIGVRSRVLAFVGGAAITTYAVGALIMFVLVDLGATGSLSWTPSASIDLALGVLLVLLAVRLRRGRADRREGGSSGSSKIDRYLQSARLAFFLGITLYVLPSPIYIGAVKAIGDAKLSGSGELTALVAVVAVMLWMIELPALALIATPERASRALEAINRSFASHGRLLAELASAGAGVYLIVSGIVGLVS